MKGKTWIVYEELNIYEGTVIAETGNSLTLKFANGKTRTFTKDNIKRREIK